MKSIFLAIFFVGFSAHGHSVQKEYVDNVTYYTNVKRVMLQTQGDTTPFNVTIELRDGSSFSYDVIETHVFGELARNDGTGNKQKMVDLIVVYRDQKLQKKMTAFRYHQLVNAKGEFISTMAIEGRVPIRDGQSFYARDFKSEEPFSCQRNLTQAAGG